VNNWDEGDFEQALINYEHMLKERPGDAELLRNYQMISLEYEKYKKGQIDESAKEGAKD
jgi:hypothetical protein